MKVGFATTWKASVQTRKQRKYRYNAPYHIKGKFLSAQLSKELREKHKMRSLRVRTGDKVKVMRGQFRGKTGKVESVDIQGTKLYLDKLEVIKQDGSKAKHPVDPSNVMITELNMNDKKRMKRRG